MRLVAYGVAVSHSPIRSDRLGVELAPLLGEGVQVDLAPDVLERRDRDRRDRGVERAAAEQAGPVGGVLDRAQPGAEGDRDDRVLAPVGREQRGQLGVPGRDVRQLAADHEAQLVGREQLDPGRRDDQRVRLAGADRDDRHERVVAHEDVRRRDADRPRALLDDRVDVLELALADAHARRPGTAPG